MDGLRFRVGPKSFYQTNSRQALVLYRTAASMARLSGYSAHNIIVHAGARRIDNHYIGTSVFGNESVVEVRRCSRGGGVPVPQSQGCCAGRGIRRFIIAMAYLANVPVVSIFVPVFKKNLWQRKSNVNS